MMEKFLILFLSTFCFVSCRIEFSIDDEINVIPSRHSKIAWMDGDNGQVHWAQFCNFDGNEIGSQQIRSNDCGSVCIAKPECVTFSWTYDEGGTCYLKDGGIAHHTGETAVCGKVLSRYADVNQKSSDNDDIKWLEKCGNADSAVDKTKTLSGLVGSIGIFFDLALATADKIIAGADKFNSCPASNACKFNITHYGKSGKNGFSTSWTTEDGSVNENDELLDGLGDQVDSGSEKINGRLSWVSFVPYGDSCVKNVVIACGDEVVPGTGYIKIDSQHMNAAYKRKSGSRNIEMDADHKCVQFNKDTPDNSYAQMKITADIFACEKNDQQCILTHLEMN